MTSSALTKLAIIGAGGHSRALIPLLEEDNKTIEGIYDPSYDVNKPEQILNYSLKGNLDDAFKATTTFVLAIGDNANRKNIFEKFSAKISPANIISKHALIRETVILGKSNHILPMVFINSKCKIGNNTIINSKALIEHECEIGNHCHISVGAIIAGRVIIGDECFIGAGAVIKDKIKICSGVTIGAGAVVVKDINEPGVYVGNPLKKIK